MTRIYKTKTGQPYIKLKSGRAKFIKRTSRTRSVAKRRTTTKKEPQGFGEHVPWQEKNDQLDEEVQVF